MQLKVGPAAPVHRHAAALPAYAPAALRRAAAIFRAAGDPERLRLLAWLAAGERCVSELAEVSGAGMPATSQRLRVLRMQGLITQRRSGKHRYYRLIDEHVKQLIDNAIAHSEEPQT